MQLFQNIKKFVSYVVQAFSSLKNWLFGSNEPIQNEEEEREERVHFPPLVSIALTKLCASGIRSKNPLGLQATCSITNPFPKGDDESGPTGPSFTWTTPVRPSLGDNISTNAAACAA